MSPKPSYTKPKLPDYDYTLEEIFKESAKEMGIEVDTVKEVYTHFIKHLAHKMSEIKFREMTQESVRKVALNFYIPGFGRILNKYGRKRNKKVTEAENVQR